jgi:hypothetical protein
VPALVEWVVGWGTYLVAVLTPFLIGWCALITADALREESSYQTMVWIILVPTAAIAVRCLWGLITLYGKLREADEARHVPPPACDAGAA